MRVISLIFRGLGHLSRPCESLQGVLVVDGLVPLGAAIPSLDLHLNMSVISKTLQGLKRFTTCDV